MYRVRATLSNDNKKFTISQGYEGDPRSNANSCVISFTIVIFQDSLHQNYDALSIFPDPITILTESRRNPRCLATRECKVNDLGHG